MKHKFQWLIPVMLLVASCQPTRHYKQPELPTAALFRDSIRTDSVGIAAIPWRSFFANDTLQNLIQEALINNLDMKIAQERIVASQAAFRRSRRALLPEVAANAGIKEAKLAFPQGYGLVSEVTQYDLGVTMAWEADIWGKLGSAKRAARATLWQSEAARQAVQTQLVASIANQYIVLLALDEQLRLLQRTVANRQEDVEAMRALHGSNLINGVAVVQSEANYQAAQIAIPDVTRQIRETENALCVLLNRTPGAIPRGRLQALILPVALHTGVPAALLANRPDVKEAELGLRIAFENTTTARSYFYPALRITGAAGYSSFEFSEWFSTSSLFANIAAGLTQPILGRGENKARLKIAESQQQQALFTFQKTVLTAGQEVSDALFMIETAKNKQQIRTEQLHALEKSVSFTKELLRYNASTNYTDVLTSEQGLLAAQTSHIGDKLLQWQGVITLYKALGGGRQ